MVVSYMYLNHLSGASTVHCLLSFSSVTAWASQSLLPKGLLAIVLLADTSCEYTHAHAKCSLSLNFWFWFNSSWVGPRIRGFHCAVRIENLWFIGIDRRPTLCSSPPHFSLYSRCCQNSGLPPSDQNKQIALTLLQIISKQPPSGQRTMNFSLVLEVRVHSSFYKERIPNRLPGPGKKKTDLLVLEVSPFKDMRHILGLVLKRIE